MTMACAWTWAGVSLGFDVAVGTVGFSGAFCAMRREVVVRIRRTGRLAFIVGWRLRVIEGLYRSGIRHRLGPQLSFANLGAPESVLELVGEDILDALHDHVAAYIRDGSG